MKNSKLKKSYNMRKDRIMVDFYKKLIILNKLFNILNILNK